MVPVAADHFADIADRDVLPGLVADVLPAGNFLEHQQAQLVAGVEELDRLRVVRGAHDVAVQFRRRIQASRRCTRAGIAPPT